MAQTKCLLRLRGLIRNIIQGSTGSFTFQGWTHL